MRPEVKMMAFVPEATGSMNAYEQATVTGSITVRGSMPTARVYKDVNVSRETFP